VDVAVPRVGDDVDAQALEPELTARALPEGDVAVVRRVEGAAEDADQRSPRGQIVLAAGETPRSQERRERS
jgi:hypothetical protein